MDATKLSVPVGSVSVIFLPILSALVWAIFKFETKEDADKKAELHAKVHQEHAQAHETIDTRLSKHEATVMQIATDVSYIRGRLEPK